MNHVSDKTPKQSEDGSILKPKLQALDQFRSLLDQAIRYGYDISFDEKSSLEFSPVEILLDALIDILLIIWRYYQFGTQGLKKNQGLGFSDKFQDVLGNPKQFRINFPREYFWDPQAQEIFLSLASTFVKIKNKESIKKVFMTFFEELNFFNPPRKIPKSKQKSQANYYWRRRRLSNRKSLIRNK